MRTNINDFEDFKHYNIVWNTKTQQYDKIPKTLKAISKERIMEIKTKYEELRKAIEEYKKDIYKIIE